MAITDAMKHLRSNPLVVKLLAAAEKQATAQARVNMATELLTRHDLDLKHDAARSLPKEIVDNLKADKTTAVSTAKASQKEVLQVAASLEVEALAKAAGAINPSVIALVASESIRTVVDDKTGEMAIKLTDKNGLTAYSQKTGRALTLVEFVNDLKTSADTANLFGDGSGVSRQGSGGVSNPWIPATRNLTQQAQIMNTDPARGARLKSEAGVK